MSRESPTDLQHSDRYYMAMSAGVICSPSQSPIFESQRMERLGPWHVDLKGSRPLIALLCQLDQHCGSEPPHILLIDVKIVYTMPGSRLVSRLLPADVFPGVARMILQDSCQSYPKDSCNFCRIRLKWLHSHQNRNNRRHLQQGTISVQTKCQRFQRSWLTWLLASWQL